MTRTAERNERRQRRWRRLGAVAATVALGSSAILFSGAAPTPEAAPPPGVQSRVKVIGLLDEINADQRTDLVMPFDHPDRLRFHGGPARRPGLGVLDMPSAARERVESLLASVLSDEGERRMRMIRREQDILGRMESGMSYEHYYLAIYGDPVAGGRWAWRFAGHHLSLHVTYEDDEIISLTPALFGANMALEREDAPGETIDPIAPRFERVRRLATSLDATQLARATVSSRATERLPRGEARPFQLGEPEGLPASALNDEQRILLHDAIDDFFADWEPALVEPHRRAIRAAAPETLHFAWRGADPSAHPSHLTFTILGPEVLFEGATTGTHHHTIWRRTDDFGG